MSIDDTRPLPVDVYRNLNNGRLSIKSRQTENYGRVIGYLDTAHLTDVEFVVQESGRKRVIEQERKNVHAFARGTLVESSKIPCDDCTTPITYNPYEYDSFVLRETEEPIAESDFAIVSTDDGVLVPSNA